MKSLRGTCVRCNRRYRVNAFGFVYDHPGKDGYPFCRGAYELAQELDPAITVLLRQQEDERKARVKELLS